MSDSAWELLAKRSELDLFIEEREGEITDYEEAIDAYFKSIDLQIANKIDGYSYILENLESRSKAEREKADKFLASSKRLQNAKDRLEKHLLSTMIAHGKTELTGSENIALVKMSPPHVVVENESMIPEAFIRQKITVSVDKIAVKQAINSGKPVPGAFLERDYKLVIKGRNEL